MSGLKEARTCGGGGGVCVSLGEGQTHLPQKRTAHNVGNKNLPTSEEVRRCCMEEVSCSESETAKDWPRASFPG